MTSAKSHCRIRSYSRVPGVRTWTVLGGGAIQPTTEGILETRKGAVVLMMKTREEGIHLCDTLPTPSALQAPRGGMGVQVEGGPLTRRGGALGWMDGGVSAGASFFLSLRTNSHAPSRRGGPPAISLGSAIRYHPLGSLLPLNFPHEPTQGPVCCSLVFPRPPIAFLHDDKTNKQQKPKTPPSPKRYSRFRPYLLPNLVTHHSPSLNPCFPLSQTLHWPLSLTCCLMAQCLAQGACLLECSPPPWPAFPLRALPATPLCPCLGGSLLAITTCHQSLLCIIVLLNVPPLDWVIPEGQ